MAIKISVAEVKSHLSEIVSKVAYTHKRVIITKRDKPIAALIDLKDLNQLNNIEERDGLLAVAGKWKNFDKISNHIEKAYKSRGKDKSRHVSL